ncbi:integrase [Alteromonas sp. V450]|nr:integrase [Alteromonas sp. V450]
MQLNGRLPPKTTLYRVKSELDEIKRFRAYTSARAQAVSEHQSETHQLSTQIAYAAGLRAHELLTLARAEERNPDKRPALHSKWAGREGQLYTVQGKGGLVRHVLIPNDLVEQLEKLRLDNPVTVTHRKINYLQRYDIGAGKRWSDSFSKASKLALFFSTGAHGLRHSYAQERMRELIEIGFNGLFALKTVSQEMGHFRPEITEVYLQ